jgi:hypothetical protein
VFSTLYFCECSFLFSFEYYYFLGRWILVSYSTLHPSKKKQWLSIEFC